jgi:hypothetical protein
MAQDVVGSKMPSLASDALKPSKAGYGQNGFAGASSDLPGENTTSGFLPAPDYAAAIARVSETDGAYKGGRTGKGNPPAPPKGGDSFTSSQTRDVSAAPITPAFGMTARTDRSK